MLKDIMKRALHSGFFYNDTLKPEATATSLTLHNGQLLNEDQSEILNNMMSIARKRPLDINIEVSNYCAASCVFCPNSKVKREKGSIGQSLFEKICDEYAAMGGGAIGISSMQSDLLSDKFLFDRLRYLQKYKHLFHIYTTTYLVGAAKFSDEQLEYFLRTFDLLQISLGGINKEQYKTMYQVNAFDTVRKQLLRIAEMVKAKNIDIALKLYFRTPTPGDVMTSDLIKELGDVYSVMEIRDHFFSWGNIIQQADLPEGAKLIVADNSKIRTDCVAAWSTLSMNIDGTVVGCACGDWNGKHPIGNLATHTLQQVWDSKVAVDFRRGFELNNIPEVCVDCALYYSVDEAFSRPALREYKPTDGLYYNQ